VPLASNPPIHRSPPFRVSITGSLFNPCVTVSLVLLGILPPFRGLLYVIAQFMGSVLASALLLGLTGTLSVKYELYRSKYHMVLTFISSTSLRPGTSVTQGVFIEMFITCALVIAVLMLAAEKHQATAFAPVSPILVILDCSDFMRRLESV
jgi:aquaporin related protein